MDIPFVVSQSNHGQRKDRLSKNLLFHFRPRRVAPEALRFSLTWGLGGLAAWLVVQQLISGVLLSVFYKPLPASAYASVVKIQDRLFLGRLLRNLHHWTGHALVLIVFFHFLRVFLNGGFAPPRHRNWFIGLGLGLFILPANFSGYLLPWDQLSYWAVTVVTAMLNYLPGIGPALMKIVRGGAEVGENTLTLFYSIHTTLVPLALFLLMAYHFWFVRRNGGILIPARQKKEEAHHPETVPAQALFVREIAFAAVASCLLLLFSMFVDAPLGNMANPGFTPAVVKAPWYFLGIQELLLHLHPVIVVCFLPLFIGAFLVGLPWFATRSGIGFPMLRIFFLAGIALLLGLTITGIWFRGPGMEWVWPW